MAVNTDSLTLSTLTDKQTMLLITANCSSSYTNAIVVCRDAYIYQLYLSGGGEKLRSYCILLVLLLTSAFPFLYVYKPLLGFTATLFTSQSLHSSILSLPFFSILCSSSFSCLSSFLFPFLFCLFTFLSRPLIILPSLSFKPYAWDAREFVRKLLVGHEVLFSVEHKVGTSGREYGHVWINKGTVHL